MNIRDGYNIPRLFLVAKGDTKSLRNVLIFTFFLNLFLNPIFIYGAFIIPAMGIKGIALATLCSQFFGLIYIIIKVNKTDLKKFLHPECFLPNFNLQKEILAQAIPAIGSMMFIGLGVFILLYYVSMYGIVKYRIFQISTVPYDIVKVQQVQCIDV